MLAARVISQRGYSSKEDEAHHSVNSTLELPINNVPTEIEFSKRSSRYIYIPRTTTQSNDNKQLASKKIGQYGANSSTNSHTHTHTNTRYPQTQTHDTHTNTLTHTNVQTHTLA